MAGLTDQVKQLVQTSVNQAINSTNAAYQQITGVQDMIKSVNGSVEAVDTMEKALAEALECLKTEAQKL